MVPQDFHFAIWADYDILSIEKIKKRQRFFSFADYHNKEIVCKGVWKTI
ncbi:MAG: hypothetical protein KDE57_00915 [Calditrichaeota bacterium]|nr:hypothetical protein [Calditrichota bacterium]